MQFACHIQPRNKTIHNSTIGAYTGSRYHFGVHKIDIRQPNGIQQKEMEERREKTVCFGCNNKWSKWHKYQET
jgi:hypothetical protein